LWLLEGIRDSASEQRFNPCRGVFLQRFDCVQVNPEKCESGVADASAPK
jgi:hypothetical protein